MIKTLRVLRTYCGEFFFGCTYRAMLSRPYRKVFAIQTSSSKNLSVRLIKASSSSLPDASNTVATLPKLTSQKILTNPNSRITGKKS